MIFIQPRRIDYIIVLPVYSIINAVSLTFLIDIDTNSLIEKSVFFVYVIFIICLVIISLNFFK